MESKQKRLGTAPPRRTHAVTADASTQDLSSPGVPIRKDLESCISALGPQQVEVIRILSPFMKGETILHPKLPTLPSPTENPVRQTFYIWPNGEVQGQPRKDRQHDIWVLFDRLRYIPINSDNSKAIPRTAHTYCLTFIWLADPDFGIKTWYTTDEGHKHGCVVKLMPWGRKNRAKDKEDVLRDVYPLEERLLRTVKLLVRKLEWKVYRRGPDCWRLRSLTQQDTFEPVRDGTSILTHPGTAVEGSTDLKPASTLPGVTAVVPASTLAGITAVEGSTDLKPASKLPGVLAVSAPPTESPGDFPEKTHNDNAQETSGKGSSRESAPGQTKIGPAGAMDPVAGAPVTKAPEGQAIGPGSEAWTAGRRRNVQPAVLSLVWWLCLPCCRICKIFKWLRYVLVVLGTITVYCLLLLFEGRPLKKRRRVRRYKSL
eukprot:jgi/Botrbrau1/14026/Bobra.0310s0012.1